MAFGVTLNSIIKSSAKQPQLPPNIEFVRKRFVNTPNQIIDSGHIMGHLKAKDPNDAYYEYWSSLGAWNVTQLRGKWHISVRLSNGKTPKQVPYYFVVDKRDQIVQLAESWEGATVADLVTANGLAGGNCSDFTAMVYRHLKIANLPTEVGDQYAKMLESDSGKGAIQFYEPLSDSSNLFQPSHTAILNGGIRININSATQAHDVRVGAVDNKPVLMKVGSEAHNAGVGADIITFRSPNNIVSGGYSTTTKTATPNDLDAE